MEIGRLREELGARSNASLFVVILHEYFVIIKCLGSIHRSHAFTYCGSSMKRAS